MPGPNSRSYALGTGKGVFYFNSHGGDGSELDIYLLRRVRQPVQALGFLDAADQPTEGLDAAVEGRSNVLGPLRTWTRTLHIEQCYAGRDGHPPTRNYPGTSGRKMAYTKETKTTKLELEVC